MIIILKCIPYNHPEINYYKQLNNQYSWPYSSSWVIYSNHLAYLSLLTLLLIGLFSGTCAGNFESRYLSAATCALEAADSRPCWMPSCSGDPASSDHNFHRSEGLVRLYRCNQLGNRSSWTDTEVGAEAPARDLQLRSLLLSWKGHFWRLPGTFEKGLQLAWSHWDSGFPGYLTQCYRLQTGPFSFDFRTLAAWKLPKSRRSLSYNYWTYHWTSYLSASNKPTCLC